MEERERGHTARSEGLCIRLCARIPLRFLLRSPRTKITAMPLCKEQEQKNPMLPYELT